jgi:hypothetical protein
MKETKLIEIIQEKKEKYQCHYSYVEVKLIDSHKLRIELW